MMSELTMYLLPIIALAVLCAGWMAIQLLARRMKTKNHIDDGGGCCGACAGKTCELKGGKVKQSQLNGAYEGLIQ